MESEPSYDEFLPVGIVQTTVNARLAWREVIAPPRMSRAQDAHVWHQICKALRAFKDGDEQPKLVVLPELSLPRSRIADFERLICSINAMAVVGVDYKLDRSKREARNEGIVFVPGGFWSGKRSRKCARVQFGKCHPAPHEKHYLENLSPQWSFGCDEKVYVFDAEQYGRIGVSICYDFMDLERAVMYRGRVHHLLVLAYNRDLGMFRSLADSLSRTVFCNVVVCNTGYYGGSVAVSPYHDAHRRTVYAHGGSELFTTQVVSLPVRDLARALGGAGGGLFKHRPPGVDMPEREDAPISCDTVRGLVQVPLIDLSAVTAPSPAPGETIDPDRREAPAVPAGGGSDQSRS